MHPGFYVILVCDVSAVILSWIYFRRYLLPRPPLGVLNLSDVIIMAVVIVMIPFLYLALPLWLVVCLDFLAFLSILYTTWQPVLRRRWAIWLVALILVGADMGAAFLFSTASFLFLIINDIVQLMIVVGITNLWAQGGMKARDLVILAGVVAIYDYVATVPSTIMDDLLSRLNTLPFAPMVAWDVGWEIVGSGLGDLLFAGVFPLVMRKAFGYFAGITAIIVTLVSMETILVLSGLGIVKVDFFPAMVVLAPLMALQYIYWRRRRGPERTTWQYLQAEPMWGQAAL